MFTRNLQCLRMFNRCTSKAAVDTAFNSKYLSIAKMRFSSSAALRTKIEFNNKKLQKYLESLRKEFYELRVSTTGAGANPASYMRMSQLNGVVKALEQHKALQGNLASKSDIENEKDEDMRQLIEEENDVYTEMIIKTEEEIMHQLLGLMDTNFYPSLIFEVNAGAGGQEAMLFAKELFDMYVKYFDYQGWDYEILTADSVDIGGLRHANAIIDDPSAFNDLQYEAGVHRVQRVPVTEKSSRIHTSTVSVTVIPRPADFKINISEKDLKIETKRASGAGGQHVNTTDSAVRIVHLPTGIAIECQSERSQLKNREIALKRLEAKLLQQQVDRAEATTQATRKSQQGNLNRNEKIRTYNYVQDRITDHRIQNGTVHNLEELLQGGTHLSNLIQRVIGEHRKMKLADFMAMCEDETSKAKKQKN